MNQGGKQPEFGSSLGVITVKHDLLLGVLIGLIVGLVYTAHLTPYLPFLVIAAVLVMTKVISFNK